MAEDGVRRSGRARKPVQSFAVEQAEASATLPTPPASQRVRKPKAKAAIAPPDVKSETDDTDPTNLPSEAGLTRPSKKSIGKKRKLAASSDNYDDDAAQEKPVKKTSRKKKLDPSSDAYDEEDCEAGTTTMAVKLVYGAGKPVDWVDVTDVSLSLAKKRNKAPPPLDQQTRQKPHSKIYPMDAKPATKGKAWHESAAMNRIERLRSSIPMLAPGEQEKRLRPKVSVPGQKYEEVLDRAQTQKMFVIARERSNELDCHAGHDDCPCETLKIAGSKGNVYTITISHLPSCTCPVGIFAKRGEEACCKHVIYVLHNVLKAPEHLEKQNAFLTTELRELFANAPPMPITKADEETKDGNRKPLSDDCPICFTDFEDDNDVVWCKAACGNNVHKTCFNQWAKARHGNVTCPFCRTPWESDGGGQKAQLANITMPSERGASGYVNVSHMFDYDD